MPWGILSAFISVEYEWSLVLFISSHPLRIRGSLTLLDGIDMVSGDLGFFFTGHCPDFQFCPRFWHLSLDWNFTRETGSQSLLPPPGERSLFIIVIEHRFQLSKITCYNNNHATYFSDTLTLLLHRLIFAFNHALDHCVQSKCIHP